MADAIQIALLVGLGIVMVVTMVGIGILVLRYLEHRQKTKNYVLENYQTMLEFTRQQCPDAIYGYNISRATTKRAEGRVLGTIVGHCELAITTMTSEGKLTIEPEHRHFIAYRPRELDFNILNPRTWAPVHRIAIVNNEELPYGLNGNVRWECASIDFYQYYVFSTSDAGIDRNIVAHRIGEDVKLNFGIKPFEEVGEIVSKAIESDSGLQKRIREISEFRPRGKQ